MAVYVDRAIWERWDRLWCHLLADDEAELHAFATQIGCERRRFEHKPRRPWVDHYDIDEERRAKAIQAGAIELSRREVCEFIAGKRAAAREGGGPAKGAAPPARGAATGAPPPARGTATAQPPARGTRAGEPPFTRRDGYATSETGSPTATRPPSSTSP